MENLKWHQASALHQQALNYYFRISCRLPTTRVIGSGEVWPIVAVPRTTQWLKFWQGLHTKQSARTYCKQMQLDLYVASDDTKMVSLDDVPLMSHREHSKMEFSLAEVIRAEARMHLHNAVEISVHFDGGGKNGYEVLTFQSCSKSFVQHQGSLGIASDHMRSGLGISHLERTKSERLVNAIGVGLQHFFLPMMQVDNSTF